MFLPSKDFVTKARVELFIHVNEENWIGLLDARKSVGILPSKSGTGFEGKLLLVYKQAAT